MSYITFQSGFSSKQMTISLWFRIPSRVVQEISTEHQIWYDAENSGPRRRFLGIIPLMTFGPTKLTSRKFYFPSRITGSVTYENKNWTDGPSGYPTCTGAGWVTSNSNTQNTGSNYYSFEQGNGTHAGGGGDLDGSYIGIDCTKTGSPRLNVCLVMPKENEATYEGAWPNIISESYSAPVVSLLGGTGLCSGAPTAHIEPGYGLCWDEAYFSWTKTQVFESNADVLYGYMPETFSLLPIGSSGGYGPDTNFQGARITPDVWHHVLISFDLTFTVKTQGVLYPTDQSIPPVDLSQNIAERTDGTVKMWVALDDNNLTGEELSAYWPKGYGDLNGILSISGYGMAQHATYGGTNTPEHHCTGVSVTHVQDQQLPTYSYAPPEVSMDFLSLPAAADYVDAIRQVEMAELQIFSGVSIDTDSLNARRLFISDEGDPVDPEVAKKEIGRPAIMLHGDVDWQEGTNTGYLGVDPLAGGVNPAGQFTPIGLINKFDPEPTLDPAINAEPPETSP